MQTFLPYPKFSTSARVLDYRRLGKQRVEAKQVLQAILDVDKEGARPNTGQAFLGHPIRAQWQPYPEALLSYTWYICHEWKRRGYKDNITPWLFAAARARSLRLMRYEKLIRDPQACPWWLGKARLHVIHRANLLVKDPIWYAVRPETIGLAKWEVPEVFRVGFGYAWPKETPGEWRIIRRAER